MKGPFLNLEELLILFPFLKKNETLLDNDQLKVLIKIEKTLYEHLSIAEIENKLGGAVENA